MKYLPAQLAYVLEETESRQNLGILCQLMGLLTVIIAIYTVVFHVLMAWEGQDHSWVTGLYWTLTVMTTLGFGDITFHSDAGRAFSTLVLVSGVFYLLIVLPFAFIRFFYAPWLDARLRLTARRELPDDTRDHVIIAQYDDVARGLIRRLDQLQIPYVVLEADPQRAARLQGDGVSVVAGAFDSRETFARVRARSARMLVANLDDASNTNLTLTFRQEAPDVPVVALAEAWDSVDILELSGASHVLPLKHTLGQQLALRSGVGEAGAEVIGRFHDLLLAELAIHDTALEGKLLRDTALRAELGLTVAGVWEHGEFLAATPDLRLTADDVILVLGTSEQIEALDDRFATESTHEGPALVIGAGKVGRAAAQALTERGVEVHVVDKDEAAADLARRLPVEVFTGDAADREVLMTAGLAEASVVLLTTNEDAINIYLAVYCRGLAPDLRIVSRITHERNLEAILRVGVDFVLSYGALAVRSLVAQVLHRKLVILGEGVDLFYVPLPPSLDGELLATTDIRAASGLNVIAIQRGDGDVLPASPSTKLTRDTDLIMIGTPAQRRQFTQRFGQARRGLLPDSPAETPDG